MNKFKDLNRPVLLFGAFALLWLAANGMAWWTFALLCTGVPYGTGIIKGLLGK